MNARTQTPKQSAGMAGFIDLQPNETLVGILPAYPGLYARFSTPGGSIPQRVPVVSIAVIRGLDCEGNAIHRFDGIAESGNALACDMPGFDGYDWWKPINTIGGNIEDDLVEYLLGYTGFVVGNGKRDNFGLPELPEIFFKMPEISTPEGRTPIEFGKDIVGIAKAILLAEAIANTNSVDKYSDMNEAANDFALISRLFGNSVEKITRSNCEPEEIKGFRKKILPALRVIGEYASGLSLYAKFQSLQGWGRKIQRKI